MNSTLFIDSKAESSVTVSSLCQINTQKDKTTVAMGSIGVYTDQILMHAHHEIFNVTQSFHLKTP